MLIKSAARAMVRAGRLLNSGNTEVALDVFTLARDAFKAVGNTPMMAEAEHMRGVCLRMLRRYIEAGYAFMRAHAGTDDRIKKARILRDWCMVPLEMGNLELALRLINDSLALLEEANGTGEKWLTEHFASLGFKCRVVVRMGDLRFARKNYVDAREGLRGLHGTYELNSTVWEMKDVSPLHKRIILAPRALRLAIKAGNAKRIVQIVLLVICRPLARRVVKN